MKLTETCVLHNYKPDVTVDGKNIYDYSTDGNYDYCLMAYSHIGKTSLFSYTEKNLVARIYFNKTMSMELHSCIHNNIVFALDGTDCDIDDTVDNPRTPFMICDQSGKPFLVKGRTTRSLFDSRICEYIMFYTGRNDINYNDLFVFGSFGRRFVSGSFGRRSDPMFTRANIVYR